MVNKEKHRPWTGRVLGADIPWPDVEIVWGGKSAMVSEEILNYCSNLSRTDNGGFEGASVPDLKQILPKLFTRLTEEGWSITPP